MDLYSTTSENAKPKAVLLTLETLLLFGSYWILLEGGGSLILGWLGFDSQPGDPGRRMALFLFNCIVYLRMWFTIAHLIRRGIPWQEAISVPFAFAVYYIGYALLGFYSSQSLDISDYLYILVFLTGSFINTYSELLRHHWRSQRENKDRLYTKGLFRYAVHINYFGDLLWVTAYAALTRNTYSFIIPAALFLFFTLYNIPKLDAHLSSRYGSEFEDYRRRVKKLIPFVY